MLEIYAINYAINIDTINHGGRIMSDFYNQVIEVLKQDNRFFSEEGEFLRNACYEATMQMDSTIIKSLFSNDETRKRFFSDVDGISVFDKVGFGWVINNRKFLPDSYTRYKNKIGLANNGGDLISTSNGVELVFPYKDCILVGGQTKDDQKRSEIFYNETLSPDEVDRLLYPKVFTSATKYSADGGIKTTKFEDKDNLIIKGNNLLALSSLLKRYEGKIKCIFIDVPYNTNNDSFQYNDSFNHSTWLTFMKNRLEIAKKLLTMDGSIALYIDNNEIGYLQVLMDEIFGRSNKGGLITVKRGSVTGHKAINPGVVNVVEYIMIYSRNKSTWKPNKIYRSRARNDRYNNFILNREKPVEEWKFCSLLDAFAVFKSIEKSKLNKVLGGDFEKEIYKFVMDNADSVIQFAYPDADKVSIETRDLIKESMENPDKIYVQKRENELDIYLKAGQRLLFYSDRLMVIDNELTTGELVSDFWDDVLPNDLASEGSVAFKKGKKPEKAIKRILELLTNINSHDIVLDFFMGSGTIPAVAHKMGLRYIGIEQMDYINTISVNRLINVINGSDKKGVTKAVNWQGGGSFIYCELARVNQNYVDMIQEAESDDLLASIWIKMRETGFINCYINPREIDTEAEDFKSLSFENKKKLFMALLDKNQLCMNYCDIDDVGFTISDEDKSFTRSFYGEDC